VPWRLVVRRLHDQAAARALKPDIPAIPPPIQFSAPPVLCNKGRQGVEDFRHGAGRLSRSLTLRLACATWPECQPCERTAW